MLFLRELAQDHIRINMVQTVGYITMLESQPIIFYSANCPWDIGYHYRISPPPPKNNRTVASDFKRRILIAIQPDYNFHYTMGLDRLSALCPILQSLRSTWLPKMEHNRRKVRKLPSGISLDVYY